LYRRTPYFYINAGPTVVNDNAYAVVCVSSVCSTTRTTIGIVSRILDAKITRRDSKLR